MSNPNFTLTYDELLLLLKEAYRNGYATYEIADAGLEPYDDDGYARWVLLGMEKNKQEELDNTDKKLHISDVSDSISFETKDYENVRVKVGESNISIKTTKRNGTFNTIYIEEGQQLFDYLKKYYH